MLVSCWYVFLYLNTGPALGWGQSIPQRRERSAASHLPQWGLADVPHRVSWTVRCKMSLFCFVLCFSLVHPDHKAAAFMAFTFLYPFHMATLKVRPRGEMRGEFDILHMYLAEGRKQSHWSKFGYCHLCRVRRQGERSSKETFLCNKEQGSEGENRRRIPNFVIVFERFTHRSHPSSLPCLKLSHPQKVSAL